MSRKGTIDKCDGCEEPYIVKREDQRFCKPKCRFRHHRSLEQFIKKQLHTNESARSFVVTATPIVLQAYAPVREAAEIAGVSETTIRKWARTERVRSVMYMGRLGIFRADLNGNQDCFAYIRGGEVLIDEPTFETSSSQPQKA